MVEEASPKPSEAADRRVASMIVAATESSSPLIAGYLKAAAPTVGKAVSFAVNVVGPPAMALARLALASYELLPVDLLSALLGVGLSFGGGAYCASITAVDAFRMGGWEQSRAALLDINADVRRVLAAHEADEKKDEDGNGVPDVRQLTSAQLLQRKMSLALQAVENPSKLSAALVPVLVRTSTRAVALSFAWRMQVVVAAVHLALRGGLLTARGVLRWAARRGYVQLDEDGTKLDEAVGYSVAAVGLYCQYQWSFRLPFPFSLVFLPLTAVEWYLRWTMAQPAVA